MLIEESQPGQAISRKFINALNINVYRSQSGKNSLGGQPQQHSLQQHGLGISSVGGGVGSNYGVKNSGVGKKSSKSYLRKNGPAITSLNLHLYGSSGKSRNSVHNKHINSLQNYSATHQQQLLSLDNRFSSSTLRPNPNDSQNHFNQNSQISAGGGSSIKSPDRPSNNRKLVQIPAHQITSSATGHYFIQGKFNNF